jgi:hypothetical protein
VGPTGNQGTRGPTGGAGPTGAVGPTGNQGTRGPSGAAGPTGIQGPTGNQGTRGATGLTGPDGPAGSAGNAIVFDTDGTINPDTGSGTTKSDMIRSFRNANEVLTNDVYWHIQTGRVFQYQGSNVTTADVAFTELTTGSGFLSADGLRVSSDANRLEIRSDVIKIFENVSGTATLRVKIGNLS